jgi:hypothetical protein
MPREITAVLLKLKSNPAMPAIPRIRTVQPLFRDKEGASLWIQGHMKISSAKRDGPNPSLFADMIKNTKW